MSWDEKDWAYTWFTGKRCRLNLLFRNFEITKIEEDEQEVGHTIREYNRDVYEFSIMSEEQMDQLARDYGIMIEYQYLGHNRYCFDYRNKDCIVEHINLKENTGLSSSLNIHSYNKYNLNGNLFKADLKRLEAFVENYEETNFNSFIIEKKIIVEQAKNLIKSLKQDIITFNNISFNIENSSFTKICGQHNRLNLLFGRNTVRYNDSEEVEAIFHISKSDITKKSQEEFLYIQELAETYGVCIKLGYHGYDFRQYECISKNINTEGISPLSNIYIGEYISSISTYEL